MNTRGIMFTVFFMTSVGVFSADDGSKVEETESVSELVRRVKAFLDNESFDDCHECEPLSELLDRADAEPAAREALISLSQEEPNHGIMMQVGNYFEKYVLRMQGGKSLEANDAVLQALLELAGSFDTDTEAFGPYWLIGPANSGVPGALEKLIEFSKGDKYAPATRSAAAILPELKKQDDILLKTYLELACSDDEYRRQSAVWGMKHFFDRGDDARAAVISKLEELRDDRDRDVGEAASMVLG